MDENVLEVCDTWFCRRVHTHKDGGALWHEPGVGRYVAIEKGLDAGVAEEADAYANAPEWYWE